MIPLVNEEDVQPRKIKSVNNSNDSNGSRLQPTVGADEVGNRRKPKTADTMLSSQISKDNGKGEFREKPVKSIKEIKEEVKNSKYKTGSIEHNLDIYKGLNLNKFFWDYNGVLNKIIRDIWETIEWKEWIIEKENPLYQYSQKRLYPHYRKDSLFKSDIRDHYLNNWKYSTHWINSAIDVAFSIMDSWKKNYNKGKRKRNYPVAKRLFVRVKQTLMNIDKVDEKDENGDCIEKDMLRISIKPRQFIYIDISGEKRYFKINGKIGEPILTPTHIHLPIRQPKGNGNDEKIDVQKIGWDLNKFSMDGFNPELGWIRISLNMLHSTHMAYDKKRRRIQKLASTKKVVGKRLKEKYSKREKNRCNQIVYEIINDINKIGLNDKIIRYIHKFEDLSKHGMFKKKRGKRGKKWNRELGYTNWKDITSKMEYKADKGIEFVDPYHTSKDCSRCGCTNKDLNEVKFVCVNCGLTIDRQFNASINVYVKNESNMEGLSQDSSLRQKWFDETILKEFTQTGAECDYGNDLEAKVVTARKETNELVRSLYDLMKPQFYGA